MTQGDIAYQELVVRLREVAALKPGDQPPRWLDIPNGWGPPISQLCDSAARAVEETRESALLAALIGFCAGLLTAGVSGVVLILVYG